MRSSTAVIACTLLLLACGGSSGRSSATSAVDRSSGALGGLRDPGARAERFDPCVLTADQVGKLVGFDVGNGAASAGSIDEMRADECRYSSTKPGGGDVSVQSLYDVSLEQVARINIDTAVALKGAVDETPVSGLPASFVTEVNAATTVFSIGAKPLGVSVAIGSGHADKRAERDRSVAVAKAVLAAIG